MRVQESAFGTPENEYGDYPSPVQRCPPHDGTKRLQASAVQGTTEQAVVIEIANQSLA